MALTVENTVMKFGSSEKAFCLVWLKKLANSEKREYKEKVNSIIKYLSKHFAKITGGRFLAWNPIDKDINVLALTDFKNTLAGCDIYKKAITKKENGDEVSKTTKEKVADVFVDKCDHMFTKIDCDVMKPRVYLNDDTEAIVFNTFKGFKWGECEVKKTEALDEEEYSRVMAFLDFIRNVLCSGNDEQFEFFRKWIIMLVNGRKCVQFVWLQGPQGTGKSTAWQLLRDRVLGKDAVLILDNYQVILPGEYNTVLEGKVGIFFEELGDADNMKSTSHQVEQALKNFTNPDNPFIQINQKYRDMREVRNYANTGFNTNNSPFASGKEHRRHFIPDINPKYARDRKYFAKLKAACDNDEFGYAFWCYCKNEYEKMTGAEIVEFINSEPPLSKRRLEKHGASLKQWQRFIKEEYVMKKFDLDSPKKAIYEEYKQWCGRSGMRGVLSMSIFFGGDHMGPVIGEEALIQPYKKYEKDAWRLKASFDDLLAYAKEHNWLEDGEEPYDVDLDEIDPDDDKELKRLQDELQERLDAVKRRRGKKLGKDLKRCDAPVAGYAE